MACWIGGDAGSKSGMRVKFLSCFGLTAALAALAAPAASQDIFGGFVLAKVCLPYASRARTFESTIRAARDMEFRRPNDDRAPIEDWETAIELVSKDGAWRVKIEESGVIEDEREIYQVRCSVSSRRASARELEQVARLALRGNENWAQSGPEGRRWDRRVTRSDEIGLRVEIEDSGDGRPSLSATGLYH